VTRFTGNDRDTAAQPARRSSQSACAGTAALGVAIVIFVLGLVVAMVVPLVQNSLRHERAAQVAGQLRDFAQAFKTYAQKRGDWPPAATAVAQAPAGMEEMLPLKWSRRTPVGGRYLWAPDALHRGQRYRATIMIWPRDREPVTADRRLLEEIDRAVDDGNLRSGNFQLGYRDVPFFVLEP